MKNNDSLKILNYWYTQELLLPQKLELPYKLNNSNTSAFKGTLEQSFTFIQQTKRQTQTGYGWEFILYGGIFNLEKIKHTLIEALHASDDFEERPQYGDAASYAVSLDQNLLPKKDGLQVSTAPWALNIIKKNKNTKKLDYKDFEKILEDLIDWLNNKEHEIDFIQVIVEINKVIEKEIGADFLYEKDLFQVVATKKLLKNIDSESSDTDMLNSFYLKDLQKTISSLKSNKGIDLLSTYLEMEEQTVKHKRIDIRKQTNYVYDMLSPEKIPMSCWATSGGHSLAFSQQFAINSIFNRLSHNSGIYSVNGAPGTGKTTMLRDLIAMVITERAEKISRLNKPSDIFESKKQSQAWKTNEYTKWFSPLKKEFLGDEIVVASSNNGAVENVTLEIPSSSSIDKQWLNKIKFFKSTGDRLISGDSWGSGAACLGNSSNKSDFVSNFWFSDKKNNLEGIDSYLKEMKDTTHEEDTLKAWVEAKKQFLAAVKIVENLKKTKIKIKNLPTLIKRDLDTKQKEVELEIKKLSSISSHLNVLKEESNKMSLEISLMERTVNTLEERFNELTKEENLQIKVIKSLEVDIDNHFKKKLSFFEILIDWLTFRGKRNKSWNEKMHFLEEKELELQTIIRKIEKSKNSQTNNLTNQKQSLTSTINIYKDHKNNIYSHQKQLDEKKNYISVLEFTLKKISSRLLVAIQERNEHEKREDKNSDKREKSSPWMDKEFHEARATVFIKALNLNKALIDANANRFRNTLSCMIDVLQNKVKENTKNIKAVEHAWATLFFFVPVVSTTFASFGRLFGHLWGEKLGWVLIDEAGQASAQASVGAMMRAKRVIAVGDPLQLEPIIGLPGSVQDILRKEAGAHKGSLSNHTSVQKRADFSEIHGTYLESNEENDIWVGSPLRVHRRCCSPMFEISNITTYNGLMVHGKKKINETLGSSRWIDVNSSTNNGHWIIDEGKKAEELVRYVLSHEVTKEDIYIISPFKDVVKGLKNYFTDLDIMKKGHIGTIHTVQGKEARVVILVLGSDPKNEGARNWASEKPNLVNVAVTRAKSRFYVIGNKKKWQSKRFFKDVVDLLD